MPLNLLKLHASHGAIAGQQCARYYPVEVRFPANVELSILLPPAYGQRLEELMVPESTLYGELEDDDGPMSSLIAI